jgi:hypothetical protein
MTFPRGVHRRGAIAQLGAMGLSALALPRPARAAVKADKFDVLVLKTAIIGKIAEFVRWPSGSGLDERDQPFEFVLLGQTPLWPHCERYYREQQVTIAGHRVFLRMTTSVADIGRPHLLFVAPSFSEQLPTIIASLGRKPVLTMGDTEGFAHRGLAVNLYLAGDRVRFEISRKAFLRHHLEASYRLLGLATLIEDQQAMR